MRSFLSERITRWFVELSVMVTPFLVSAQLTAPAPIRDLSGAWGVACDVATWIFRFAIVVAIASVLIAAYRYLTSGGEEDQVRKAHQAVTFAAVGVAVAILAAGVPSIVNYVVGRGGIKVCP